MGRKLNEDFSGGCKRRVCIIRVFVVFGVLKSIYYLLSNEENLQGEDTIFSLLPPDVPPEQGNLLI